MGFCILVSSCNAGTNIPSDTIVPLSIPKYVHTSSFVGDVHPVYFNGQLYMYYLKTGGNYQSALFKSNNLVTFSNTNIKTDPLAAPYSVLYVFQKPNSNDYISYYSATVQGGFPNGVMKGSVSTDLLNWSLMGSTTTVQEPIKKYYHLKDPYVFWNKDKNNYWAVRSGKETANGTWEFLYYTSNDLKNWQDRGTLYKTKDVYGPIECPQMFKLGDYWYLLYSEYSNRVGKPQYFYSIQPEGPWQKVDGDNSLDGSDNCAAQIVEVNGKCLLYGWIPSSDTETIGFQWGGPITLARELYNVPNGRLFSKLESSVSNLIRGEKLYGKNEVVNLTSTNTTAVTNSITGLYKRFDMSTNFTISLNVEAVGVFFEIPNGSGITQIRVELSEQYLSVKTGTFTHSTIYLPLSTGTHTLRVISDKDVLECFVDDKYALSAMVSKDITAASIKTFVTNGTVSFSELQVFSLNNTNNIK